MNENKRVYICDIDYLYTEKSPEFGKYAGGSVYIFVKAYDVREAVSIIENDLNKRTLDLRELVSVAPYVVNQEWDTEQIQTHYLLLYKECDLLGDVVYDDFMAYEAE